MTEPEQMVPGAPPVLAELAQLEAVVREVTERGERCFQSSARLARAAMFWNILLILAGALVAACGGLTNSLGSRAWLAVVLVVLGVLVALGSAYQGFVKPRERSTQLAKLALEYRSLARRAQERAAELMVEDQRDAAAIPLGLRAALASLTKRVTLEVEVLQLKEIDLFVGGTTNLGRTLPS